MNLERAFRLSSILMAAVGFTGLVMTQELPLGLVTLGAGALIAGIASVGEWGPPWLGRPYRLLSQMPVGVWNALMIVAFAAFWIDLFWISGDMLPAAVHFLILLLVNKLFCLRSRKDFLHLYALSLLALLSTAALTVDLWYGGVFIAYLFASIWTMLLYHLRTEDEEERARAALREAGSEPPTTPRPITARFFWTTNGIAVGVFFMTLVIFFLVPRIGAGFFQKSRIDLIKTSGFSERVDLGMIGKVKLDPTVVMRVEFPDHKGPVAERMRLYFRGAAYDAYDGRSWSNLHPFRRMLDRTSGGAFQVPSDARPMNAAGPGIRQEILIEALDTTVLFGVSFVESIKGQFSVPYMDRLGGLSLPYTPASRFQYTVISTPAQPADGDRTTDSFGYPRSITDAYLQVPEKNLRVSALAQEVTRASRTPYEKAQAIERHLKQSYRYSLDVGTSVPAHPLEEFLFIRKTGFCEHYATAMVVMLRSLGIPARLVTGFLPGEWNDFGNYYSVRQQDAHAWVEVYFPGSGWLTFDPTPSVATPPPPFFMVAKMGRFVDSIRLKWDRYVVQYSFRDQMDVVQGIREQSDRARTQAGQWLAPLLGWMGTLRTALADLIRVYGTIVIGVAGACALGIALIVAVAFRRRRGGPGRIGDSRTAGQVAAVQVYSRMLRFLETRGVRKTPSATPLEFSRVVSREWGEAARFVGPLTDLYCRVRFGQAPLSPEELRMAEDFLTGLHAIRR